jgi:hypothetical protein
MATGKRKRHAKQASLGVAMQGFVAQCCPSVLQRLSRILDKHGFAGYLEGPCERFYVDESRPELQPGRHPPFLPGRSTH